MAKGQESGSDTPARHRASQRVAMIGTDPRTPSGPAVNVPRKQAAYMTAPDSFAKPPKKVLAEGGPSIHDGSLILQIGISRSNSAAGSAPACTLKLSAPICVRESPC